MYIPLINHIFTSIPLSLFYFTLPERYDFYAICACNYFISLLRKYHHTLQSVKSPSETQITRSQIATKQIYCNVWER